MEKPNIWTFSRSWKNFRSTFCVNLLFRRRKIRAEKNESFWFSVQTEFGIRSDVQTNPDNSYLSAINGFFSVDLRLNFFAKAGILFPQMADFLLAILMKIYRLAAFLNFIEPIPIDALIQRVENHVRTRLNEKRSSEQRLDLVEMLLDARTEVSKLFWSFSLHERFFSDRRDSFQSTVRMLNVLCLFIDHFRFLWSSFPSSRTVTLTKLSSNSESHGVTVNVDLWLRRDDSR